MVLSILAKDHNMGTIGILLKSHIQPFSYFFLWIFHKRKLFILFALKALIYRFLIYTKEQISKIVFLCILSRLRIFYMDCFQGY